MKLFDRFTGKEINTDIDSLPKDIQMGRFFFLDGQNQGRELTRRLFMNSDKHLFHQEVLKNDFICTVLQQIDADTNKPSFRSVPFLKEVGDHIKPNPFETLLLKKLDDIKYMCINPAVSLDREIQKVHIGKAGSTGFSVN